MKMLQATEKKFSSFLKLYFGEKKRVFEWVGYLLSNFTPTRWSPYVMFGD